MPITIKEIHESIHAGACAANEKYEKWSDGWWLNDSGVESLLVCEIAEQIHKHQSERESLLLELPFKKIQQWSGARRPPGRPPSVLRGGNRADIVLFNIGGMSKFVIEVKRRWVKETCIRDLERICALVQVCAAGSLKRGFLAVFLIKRVVGEHDMEWKINRITDCIENNIEDERVGVRFTRGRINEMQTENNVWQYSSLSVEILARK